eukprot:m.110401 g.110401  ORF g.110401 m.110401 type:complete len:992 (-) comp13402_c0_seq1:224-3199(-)
MGKKGKGKKMTMEELFSDGGSDSDSDQSNLVEAKDDEEIVSDDAFDSEDERKYGRFFGTSAAVAQDDEDEDLYDEDGLYIGPKAGASNTKSKGKAKGKGKVGNVKGSQTFKAYESDSSAVESDDSDAEERHQQLLADFASVGKKHVFRSVRHETGDAELSNIRTAQSVSLQDLVGTLGEDVTGVGAVKKRLEKLKSKEKELKVHRQLSTGESNAITREVVYKKTKGDLDKWMPVVTANRKKEHLSFVPTSGTKALKASNTILTATFRPKPGLEAQVQAALVESQVIEQKDKALTKAEQLAMEELDPEEVKERMSELARYKALNSYFEAKHRRMKKIKSRSYRKIRRKAKQSASANAEDLLDVDPETAIEMLKKQERKRAEERLTLRHRNQGKWAKRMLTRGAVDVATRQALGEQMQQNRELLKKATMVESSDEDPDQDLKEGASDIDEEEDLPSALSTLETELGGTFDEKMKQDSEHPGLHNMKFMRKAFEKKQAEAQKALEALRAELAGDGTAVAKVGGEASGKRLFSPATWKSTEEDDGEDGEEVDESKLRKTRSTAVRVNKGIVIEAGPSTRTRTRSMAAASKLVVADEDDEANLSEDDSDAEHIPLGAADALTKAGSGSDDEAEDGALDSDASADKQSNEGDGDSAGEASDDGEERIATSEDRVVTRNGSKGTPSSNLTKAKVDNPWLTASAGGSGTGKRNVAGATPAMVLSSTSTQQEKRLAKLQRKRLTTGSGADASSVPDAVKEHVSGNGGVSVAPSTGTGVDESLLVDAQEAKPKKGKKGKNSTAAGYGGSQQRMDLQKGSEEQLELIRDAFAGDNVVEEDFAAEKEALVDAQTIKDEDVTLPGWGTWGGNGLATTFPKKRIVKKAPEQAPRRDGKLKNVIINEKTDKKLQKRLVANVPFPFKTMDQFERSVRAPVGREWATDKVHRQSIRPKIETEAGAIIAPMKLTKGIVKDGKRRQDQRKKELQAKMQSKRKKRSKATKA